MPAHGTSTYAARKTATSVTARWLDRQHGQCGVPEVAREGHQRRCCARRKTIPCLPPMSAPSSSPRGHSAAWLRQLVVQESRLAAEGAYPLYAYRCSDEMFDKLEALLRLHATLDALDNDLCACFCLYTAEWWRRRYAGGPWAWEPILEAAGLAPLTVPKREQVVIRGLRRWGRALLRVGDRTGYLVTLACEGGLPLSMLQREGARLRRYFRALLHDLHIFPQTMPRELAERNEHHLPASFRQRPVFEMAAHLAASIHRLQRSCAGAADCIAHLDAHCRGWRSEIPLRLDDAVANELLRNLLADAAAAERAPRPTIVVETILIEAGATSTLERRLRLPPVARTVDVAATLGMQWDALPRVFDLSIQAQDATPAPVASVTRSSEGEEGAIRLEPFGAAFPRKGERAIESVELIATRKGRTLAVALVEGGAALGELPWVFTPGEDSGTWRLAGQGSVSLRREVALIAVADGAAVSAESGGAARLAGRLVSPARHLYEISGRVSIDLGDGTRCVVALSQTSDELTEYRPQGVRPPNVLSGSEVWRGMPKVREQREGRIFAEVPRDKLEWRPRGVGAPWRRVVGTCLGDIEVRYAPQGIQRFRARWTVLPEGTEIEVVPKDRGKGEIVLRGLGPCDVGPTPPATEQRVSSSNEIRLFFASEVARSESVLLELAFANAPRAVIEVPYPSREARFLGRDGRPHPDGAKIWVEQLAGVRAQVLDALPGGAFLVEGVLRARDGDTTKLRDVQEVLHELHPGRHELDLRVLADTLRVLLSASQALDTVVRVSLQSLGGRPLPRCHIEVARYDAGIHREGLDVVVDPKSRERLGPRVEVLRFEARPLADPTAPAVQLAKVEPGHFRFDPPAGAEGPWLVTGWEGHLSNVRPLCISVGERKPPEADDPEPSDDVRLREVAHYIHWRTRAAGFRKVVARLARAPEDPDWLAIEALVDTLGTLPATTFEVVPRLVEDPDAVALLLLRAGSPVTLETIWRGLETLPFLVSLVPLGAWLRATQRLQRSIQRVCEATTADATRAFAQMVEPFATTGPVLCPAIGVVLDALSLSIPGFPEPQQHPVLLAGNPGGRQFLLAELEQARQRLLREHVTEARRDDGWWPHADFTHLELDRELGAARSWIWPSADGFTHRTPVLHAPAVAACATVLESVRLTVADRFELIKLRQFAPAWFDEAHSILAALLAGDRLQR
jgi:hypothetical protein